MGKREEEPKVERGQPGAPEAEVLDELRKLIKPAYEDEFRERMRLMRENEGMSRECIEIEEDIREHQEKHAKLTEAITNLRQNRDELQKSVDGLISRRSSLASDIEKLSANKKSLEDELTHLRKQNRGLLGAIDKFQGERRTLIS